MTQTKCKIESCNNVVVLHELCLFHCQPDREFIEICEFCGLNVEECLYDYNCMGSFDPDYN